MRGGEKAASNSHVEKQTIFVKFLRKSVKILDIHFGVVMICAKNELL